MCMHGVYMQVDPELELPGYGSEDLFQELDTVEHCWECMAGLLLCSIRPPGMHCFACRLLEYCRPPSGCSIVTHAVLCHDVLVYMQVCNCTLFNYQTCNVMLGAELSCVQCWSSDMHLVVLSMQQM